MDIRETFYWVASIALLLLGLFLIAMFGFLFYLKRLAERTADRVLTRFEDMSDKVGRASSAWRSLTLTRFIIRVIRYLI